MYKRILLVAAVTCLTLIGGGVSFVKKAEGGQTVQAALAKALVPSENLPQREEDLQSRVKRKAAEFQDLAPGWVAAGGDPKRISPLGERLDRHFKSGNLKEAEKVLDEIIAIMKSSGPKSAAPRGETKTDSVNPVSGNPVSVRLGTIPSSAEIVFHDNKYISVMDSEGRNVTRITFERPRHLEHVAVAPDRRRMVANYFARPSEGGMSSRLVLFDLSEGTETELVPDFKMAGNGGVDWDRDGYIYFAGIERQLVMSPRNKADFIANMAANDIYKIRYDGTGLKRLTNTPDRGEADVSVSEDGTMIAYMATKIDPPNDYTEIWVNDTDGGNARLVYKGGKDRVASVHDPELSPDNRRVIFSKVNTNYKNFRNDPNANTAHDIYSIGVDGRDLKRLTEPGPICVIPDWRDSRILYLLLTDRESPPFHGIVVMDNDGRNPRKIKSSANIAKWIPRVEGGRR